MKLRNKKTGEIWDIGKVLANDYPSYKEEAEKAVEKLKAWKRLKDIYGKPISVNLMFNKGVQLTYDKAVQNIIDLTLLFGGENEI